MYVCMYVNEKYTTFIVPFYEDIFMKEKYFQIKKLNEKMGKFLAFLLSFIEF